MTVKTPVPEDNWDHSGSNSADLRVLSAGLTLPDRGPGWRMHSVTIDQLRDSRCPDGDCVLADATMLGALGVAGVAKLALPLVIAVSEAVPTSYFDYADGVIFADDDTAAVAAVLARAAAVATSWQVSDFSDSTRGKINALSAEAQRIADALNRLAADERRKPVDRYPVDAALVRRLIHLRRDRDRWFPAEIFADPAWDMLLDLIAARLEGNRVPVSSLCIAAAVPTSTALRWVRSLQEAGLFIRHVDPDDARRSYIILSDTAADAMLTWLRLFAGRFTARENGR